MISFKVKKAVEWVFATAMFFFSFFLAEQIYIFIKVNKQKKKQNLKDENRENSI